jgi:tRNA G18 (ribose-2'-O)-methylase SpoU
MSTKLTKIQKINWSILLHNIRSVQNVASIFRLSECFGVDTIYLSGVTPNFLDRFGRVREDFIKISLGTEKIIKIDTKLSVESLEESEENFPRTLQFIRQFRKSGGVVVGLEQSDLSVDYKKIKLEKVLNKNTGKRNFKKYLIIPGREVEGLDKRILQVCDMVAEIPQYGKKESLNIVSACGVVVSRWFDS